MRLRLSQQATELAYSVFLVVLIPAAVIGSTLWLTSQVKSNFDLELRRKANLANEVFGVSVANALRTSSTDQAAQTIQSLIDESRRHAPDIEQLSVAVPDADKFKTLASSDPAKPGRSDESIQTQFAYSRAQSVASLIASGEGESRQWLVATPVLGPDGQPIAVTSMRVSLHAADELMASTLRTTFIVLAVILVVIILLLLNHFRFVEYAELFRKQKELDQMKDDFISIATHELKAPMSVIKGYLSMILEEKLPKAPADMAKIAYDQTDRLGRLVTDLLDVSRIEQGRTKYNIGSVDLPATIGPMMGNFEVKAKDKKIGLRYAPPENLPAVKADPDRVMEIFTNLIDNAIKYSRTGTVRIEHTVSPAAVMTAVSDTGIGMSPEEQGKLFQRFYRAKNDDTKDIAGTGLGLWIIKQYIEAMGGTITVTSEKGKGTTFSVLLPRVTPEAPQTD
ncbi:MAG: two-component sensor histidine kinase [Candidatus Saccharibacteria bacterium]|jgi:signal transduction histidine kinase|nr:two-component sensor histidine kinase [Candidatus Saccharibacteria bacterium]